MNDHTPSSSDALDELVTQLLECGGVVSQIAASLLEFQSSGRSAPDAAPIPGIAHSLVPYVSRGVRTTHSKRDLRVAARIVHEVTAAIAADLYVIGPELD